MTVTFSVLPGVPAVTLTLPTLGTGFTLVSVALVTVPSGSFALIVPGVTAPAVAVCAGQVGVIGWLAGALPLVGAKAIPRKVVFADAVPRTLNVDEAPVSVTDTSFA